MTIFEFAGLLKRHWLLIVASVALCVTIAISAAMFLVTPSYSATVELYVSGTGATASDRLNNGEYARTHISSYASLVNSNELYQAVRDTLGVPSTGAVGPSDLADSITASNPLNSLIIDVTVRDSSPEQAQAVAAALGRVYDSVVARLESPSDGSTSPVRINVVSPPILPTAKDSPSIKLYAVGGLVVGLAVGVALAWLLELRQPRLRRVPVSVQERRNGVDVAISPKPPKTLPGHRRPAHTAPIAPDGNLARPIETEGPGGADL